VKKVLPIVIGVAFAAPAMAADLPEPVSGSTALLASNCFNCHGTDGRNAHAIPPLAGLAKPHLVSLLKEYKEGKREATIMHQLAKGYTDDEIDGIADYFSKQKR
jgi:cytochrome c553